MESFSRTEFYNLKYSLTKNSLLGEEGAQGITIKGPGSKWASQPHMRNMPTGAAWGLTEPGSPTHTWDLSALGRVCFSLAAGTTSLLSPISDSLAGPIMALTLPSSVPEHYTTPSKHVPCSPCREIQDAKPCGDHSCCLCWGQSVGVPGPWSHMSSLSPAGRNLNHYFHFKSKPSILWRWL